MNRATIVTTACLSLLSLLPGLSAPAATITSGIDTYVREALPNTSFGTDADAQWDGADGGGENHALIHFDIFTGEGGPVDPATIPGFSNLRAYIQFDVINEGDAGNLHRMTTTFDETTTWNDLGAGVTPGVNAVATADATTNFMRVGTHRVDVTSSIQAWAAVPGSNLGWGVVPTGTNGLEFATLDSGTAPILVLGNATDYVTRGVSGSMWSYYDAIPPPPAVGSDQYPTDGGGNFWTDIIFDDSSWATGTGELGFGDGDEATTVASGNLTYLFRTSFMVGGAVDELWIELLRDDSAVVYVNGTEVLRDNLPVGPMDPSITASSTGDENDVDWFQIDETLLLPYSMNVIAVEIHNASLTSSDISFDLALTGFDPIAVSNLPEPGSGLLLGLGLTLFAAQGRRRRSRARRTSDSRHDV